MYVHIYIYICIYMCVYIHRYRFDQPRGPQMRKVAEERMTTDDCSHCFRVADGLRAHVYHLGCNRSLPLFDM